MEFWKVIELASERPLNIDKASEKLTQLLSSMSRDDVFEFCCEMDRKMDEAYQWELWGLAYLIEGGCGDDSFMDFRASLIALGKDVYEAAIGDSESLLELGEDELREMFEEGFVYASTEAYQNLTGEQPETGVSRKHSPSGVEWEESRESLMKQYPKAWLKYGWEEPEATPNPEPVANPTKPWWKFW